MFSNETSNSNIFLVTTVLLVVVVIYFMLTTNKYIKIFIYVKNCKYITAQILHCILAWFCYFPVFLVVVGVWMCTWSKTHKKQKTINPFVHNVFTTWKYQSYQRVHWPQWVNEKKIEKIPLLKKRNQSKDDL